MENPSTSKSNGQELCKLCNTTPRRYTCPKCDIPYCSVRCYKSESHSDCSENFYKEWVESELKAQERDPQERRKMIDILKRVQAENIEFEDDFNTGYPYDDDPMRSMDSDDEEDVPDLEERLKSIDLDDADQLWGVLTNSERQEFEAIVRNGEVANFLPQWTPWWSNSSEKKIIEEIDVEKRAPDYAAQCPTIIHVPDFNELSKASPSVRFNLLNVLHAYVYVVMHCNGDHQNSAKESIAIFLQLSDNMLRNEVYEDSGSAIEAVFQKITDCPSLSGDMEAMAVTQRAVNLVIKGPEESNSTFYVQAALSDLHRLFANARKDVTSRQEKPDNHTFTKRFCPIDSMPDLSKKTLLLCMKKIEYYLSWVKKYGLKAEG